MRIAVFGVGAMACLFGSRLTPHADVTLIGRWPEQLEALRRGPLLILEPGGASHTIHLIVTDDPATIGPVDLALVLTKSARTALAAQQAAAILKPDGLAITLQNGLGNLEILAHHLGEQRAAQGVTTYGASIDGPGVLRLGGAGLTHLTTRPEIDRRIRNLASLLQTAGFAVELASDLSSLVWGKLVVNAGINPLTAILRVPNGALLDSQWACSLMHEAAREVAAVATAQGIVLPFPDPAARAEEVARLTAPNRSSMLQDVLRGAPTEIEAICGAITRIGQSLGVPTPVNALLYRLVKAIEQTYPARLLPP